MLKSPAISPNTSRPTWTAQNQSPLEAWQAQVARASAPELSHKLRAREGELLPQFIAQYERLRALPRRVRRAIQRKVAVSLAGVALLLALGHDPGLAATINVDGTTCTIVDAITAANTNAATGGCSAGSGTGSGADTISLISGSTHTLTAAKVWVQLSHTKGANLC